MKKTLVGLTALALLLVGCGSRPPVPELTAGTMDIPVVRGSCSWTSFGKHVMTDAPGPAELVKDTPPVTVKPGSEARIKFPFLRKPEKLILSRWAGSERAEQAELKSNKWTLPMEKGEYIFSIRATWGKHNSAEYAFIVRVE